MRTSRFLLACTALIAVGAAACEQSAKRPVRASAPQPPLPMTRIEDPLPLNLRPAVASLTPRPRPAVEVLLEAVEASFQSGERNYKAGHLEKARHDFDRAVDWLLMSGLDVGSDPRLERLFDRILKAVQEYEMAAFRQGDGFAEQSGDPAPIDEIAEMTFPLDPRLKEKVENELRDLPHDLPIVLADPVLSYLSFFQTPRGRAIVERGMERAGRYRAMILRILREEGLPQDLIYVAQAESAFLPLAKSRANARGMWQFMSYTARLYDLKRTWWVDERLDPEKATRAAARHLRDLYAEFGDWHLAIAAYNSGAANVARGVQRTGYADFWELHNRNVLPRETKNYVPIIMALTLMAKDPARYGIVVEPSQPLATDRVRPAAPIDLRLVAETIDVSVETLRELNPQLLRMVTPPEADFELHLPAGTAERFFAEIAAIPQEKWVSWRRHRVEEGETLSGIAKKYRVTPAAIAEANSLPAGTPLQVGEKLIIPATTSADAARGKLTRYRVRRGDTLQSIAEQFDVTIADLRRWNGIRGNQVARGKILKVYPGGQPAAKSKARGAESSSAKREPAKTAAAGGSIVHQVKPGETLWSIARAYETTVEALRAANQFLLSRQLRAGDQLLIPATALVSR
jgi:membrane-bound lytic murein transglycosylase D